MSGTSADDQSLVEMLDSNTVRAVFNGAETHWPADAVQLIEFSGAGGADVFENRTSIPAVATGGSGADTLTGGAGPVSLFGGSGDDLLVGGTAHDSLSGGDGNDTLSGLSGNDVLTGGRDNDELFGGTGQDVIIGGLGRDQVSGDEGEDIVLGGHSEYDANPVALAAIQAEWTAVESPYTERVRSLTSRSSTFPLDIWQFGVGGNVYDDLEIDTVSGGAGADLILAPADPQLGVQDVVTSIEAGERLVAPHYTPQPLAPGPALPRPSYLETVTDPAFGTQITRISGDPGTTLSIPLPAGSEGGTLVGEEVWGPAIRNHYVTDSAWNVDGSLIALVSASPIRPYRVILGGDPNQPDEYLKPVAIHESSQTQYRWSQDPTRPSLQYAFPADHVTTDPVEPGPEDHLIHASDALTGLVRHTILLPFNKLRTSKLSVAFVNGQNHVALIGRDRGDPAGPIKLYIVNLDAEPGNSPVLASMDLEAGVTPGEPNPSTMRFSPDGQFVLLAYPRPGGGRSWRLLERGPDGSLRPHAQPALAEQTFFAPGNGADGFFAVNWGHPIFAYDSQFNTHVVGSPYNFDDVHVPGVATFNNNTSRVGSLLSYNISTRSYRSLTDSTPTRPSTPVAHVTATNYANPGKVVAVFGRSPASGGPSGQLVSINLDDPEAPSGAVGLLHHRSSFNGVYFAQPHPVLSPDGTQLIYSSTWGRHQGRISTFVANLVPSDNPRSSDPIDLNASPILSYGGHQDFSGGTAVSSNGAAIEITGNHWKAIDLPYTVTPDTVLEFDFQGSRQGEIHGIGFDTDLSLSRDQLFQLYGTQLWGLQESHTYTGAGTQHFRIPLGQFLTGHFRYLVFVNDHDTEPRNAQSVVSNIRIYENEPVSLVISGPSTVDEYASASYTAAVTYEDGTRRDMTGHVKWTENAVPTTLSSGGVLTAGLVESDTSIQINAVFQGMSADYTVTVQDVPGPGDGITDLRSVPILSYGGRQDFAGGTAVSRNGAAIEITGNHWKAIDLPYTVTPDTVLEFDFQSSRQGEIHGIGFDTDLSLSRDQLFQLYGTQLWGRQEFHTHAGSGTQHFRIPVGQFLTGSFRYVVFANDHDTDPRNAQSVLSNIRIYEDVAVPVSLVISGPSIVDEYSTARYTATATFDNGSTRDVTGKVTWYEDAPLTTVDSDGVLSTGSVDVDTPVRIGAVFQGVSADYSVTVQDVPGPGNGITDLRNHSILSYGRGQDAAGEPMVIANGAAIEIIGNHWKAIELPYTVTLNTVLEFDFESSRQGEIHGIGFDTDLALSSDRIFQVYGTQGWGLQDFHTYSGTGTQNFRIPVGQFLTGSFGYLVFVNDHDAEPRNAQSVISNLRIYEDVAVIDLRNHSILSYGRGQDAAGEPTVFSNGAAIEIIGNHWKAIEFPYTVTANTVLEFEFESSRQGEIHGIGFDTDLALSSERIFQVYGTQGWGLQDFHTYSGTSRQHFRIPVGQFLTGSFGYLVFVNDHDAGPRNAQSVLTNLRIYEASPAQSR